MGPISFFYLGTMTLVFKFLDELFVDLSELVYLFKLLISTHQAYLWLSQH